MGTSRWAPALIAAFPNLSDEDFEIVSPPSDSYNCIAYVANDTSQRWDPNAGDYWPPWASRNDRIDSLKQVFAGMGTKNAPTAASKPVTKRLLCMTKAEPGSTRQCKCSTDAGAAKWAKGR